MTEQRRTEVHPVVESAAQAMWEWQIKLPWARATEQQRQTYLDMAEKGVSAVLASDRENPDAMWQAMASAQHELNLKQRDRIERAVRRLEGVARQHTSHQLAQSVLRILEGTND